jgi:small subunit ribosomal protein S6
MFLLDPNKVSGDVQGASQATGTLLERNGAEILASRPWDERKLAYPIKNVKKDCTT